jgi:hypothetical protein
MCHEWGMRRQFEEAEEGRRLWQDFEPTRPVGEPEVSVEEPEVTLEEREAARAPAER